MMAETVKNPGSQTVPVTLVNDIRGAIREVPDFPKPGIMFKDITPVFYDQNLCNRIVDAFVGLLGEKPDAIVGIESRGFLFGFMVANRLGVPFVLARKAGKLPHRTLSVEYALEYGVSRIEMHADALKPGWKVIIHDDLLATGGTAAATAELVRRCGAEVLGFNFLTALDFLDGKKKLTPHTNQITCLVHY
jgi:adenine phosphoribosyltransferase